MEYYLWENSKTEGDAFIYSGWPPEFTRSFHSGDRIVESVPSIEIVMNERSQGRLTDNLLHTGRGHVFSEKLLDVLRSCGVDNIDTYACTIRNLVSGAEHHSHSVVNIIGKISCIDRSKSQLVLATGEVDQILGYDRIRLDESKIGGARLFLLAEMPVQIVAHERVVEACRRVGITGVEFQPQDID